MSLMSAFTEWISGEPAEPCGRIPPPRGLFLKDTISLDKSLLWYKKRCQGSGRAGAGITLANRVIGPRAIGSESSHDGPDDYSKAATIHLVISLVVLFPPESAVRTRPSVRTFSTA